MNPRLVRPDDFARLKRLAVQRDCQRPAQVDTRQTSHGHLEFQRRGSGHLDFHLRADFTVSGSRRDGFAMLFVVPP
jgi:hypothetical protein